MVEDQEDTVVEEATKGEDQEDTAVAATVEDIVEEDTAAKEDTAVCELIFNIS